MLRPDLKLYNRDMAGTLGSKRLPPEIEDQCGIEGFVDPCRRAFDSCFFASARVGYKGHGIGKHWKAWLLAAVQGQKSSNVMTISELLSTNPDMPSAWRNRLREYCWTAQTIGESGALVFRLEAAKQPTLFVKSELAGAFSELSDEISRLKWLAGQGIAAPQVLDQTQQGDRLWLLMSAVPGRDLASDKDVSAETLVRVVAGALQNLHGLDIASCPFDHSLNNRISVARSRMLANQVDESDFDEIGPTAAELFEKLVAMRPGDEDLVVTHGDACLPNILSDGSHFTGFVDCARLGIADRYQDLALASRSIEHNLGVEWVGPFFRLYGIDADSARVAYYRLMDEFF